MPAGDDVVRVWMTDFSAEETPALLATARELLTPHELDRAERLRLPSARAEFVLGRALLRVLLAERMGCAALRVPLIAEQHRKPRVAGGVEFNLAHSGGHIAIAMTAGTAVGVDLERMDRKVEFLEIAEGNFAVAERAVLARAAEGEARERCFYRIWTRKEAVVKAAGDGLVLPLDGFDVSPEGAGELGVTVLSVESGISAWHVRDLVVTQAMQGRFAAALAVSRPGMAVAQTVVSVGLVDAMLEAGLYAGKPWRTA